MKIVGLTQYRKFSTKYSNLEYEFFSLFALTVCKEYNFVAWIFFHSVMIPMKKNYSPLVSWNALAPLSQLLFSVAYIFLNDFTYQQ